MHVQRLNLLQIHEAAKIDESNETNKTKMLYLKILNFIKSRKRAGIPSVMASHPG